MKAIQIIGRLRERYSNKYTQTPNKDKDHYIRWLQDEYAELAMEQANEAKTSTESVEVCKRVLCKRKATHNGRCWKHYCALGGL